MDGKDRLFVRLNAPRKDLPKGTPNVIFSLTTFKKMRLWCQLGTELNKVEISGLGTIVPRHAGLFVNDIWLIRPEKVGAGHVDMDGLAVQELMMEVMTRGPRYAKFRESLRHYYEKSEWPMDDMDGFEQFANLMEKSTKLRNLRFHWHSHNNFGVGWSGTDERTARQEFAPDAKWTVSVVTNAMGDFLGRQDFPSTQGEPIHNLPVWLFLGIPQNMSKKYRLAYEEKVKAFIDNRDAPPPEDVPMDELADQIEEGVPQENYPLSTMAGSSVE